MESDKNTKEIIWKKINDRTEVSHFFSETSRQQIYIKKIFAEEISKTPTTIFLFHDITSYHGRFLNLINWFKTKRPDLSFIMMDFSGHGLSSGTRGHLPSLNEIVEDMAQVFQLQHKNENEVWVALGHGVGALGILDLLNCFDKEARSKIDKIILSNFFLQFPSKRLQVQNKLFETFSAAKNILNASRPLEIYKPSDMLTDSHEQALYHEDPLIVRCPTFATLNNIKNKVKNVYQDSYFLDKPTLLLNSQSPYLIEHAMISFAKSVKKELLTEKKYSNLKHDLYNERENTSVFNEMNKWV